MADTRKQNAVKLLPCAVRNVLTEFASTRIGFGSQSMDACCRRLETGIERATRRLFGEAKAHAGARAVLALTCAARGCVAVQR
jgi:hypothetical protein